MKLSDPGIQVYARQLGVSPATALTRLEMQQIGQTETHDYDPSKLPELTPYANRFLELHLAMDQADRIPAASPAMEKERDEKVAALIVRADALTAEIITTHGIAALRRVVAELREHKECRAQKGAA